MSGHPWREPWSASPAAAGLRPRPWAQALERAIYRMFLAGNSPERIAAALGLPVDRIKALIRAQEPKP